MYDKFTDRSRKVIQLAEKIAERNDEKIILSHHLLGAIIEENSGVGANVLRQTGRHGAILQAISEYHDDTNIINVHSVQKLPMHPDVRDCLKMAEKEANALNHKYIGTEHLLLALLRLDEICSAIIILKQCNVDPESVRKDVFDLLGKAINRPAEKIKIVASASEFASFETKFGAAVTALTELQKEYAKLKRKMTHEKNMLERINKISSKAIYSDKDEQAQALKEVYNVFFPFAQNPVKMKEADL